ncbi:MAG: UDP-N-acetylglucosamine--N-acetylmuramyl-(pentapeptide) pyrophosphoryl-undecaprenol N-acetylglucosamine transferase [Rickettsiales bacterium]|nr:UDP-N-acetylglucosamine--N-acetylmuramyl-(pentapeptide) pyrophosphoryl-undecaprenol N-acetylglucosamine transferase [Rickettsiales bacterium]
MPSLKKNIFIVAGGTGGHIIPARCVSEELSKNYTTTFFGDCKLKGYIREDDVFKSRIIMSSQISKSPAKLIKAAIKISLGIMQSLCCLLWVRPKYIIAFGGYATFPMLVASVILRKKIILHEQNSHLGKVNRIFAKYAYKIALSFPSTDGLPKTIENKTILTGNPVRKEILALNDLKYELPVIKYPEFRKDNKMGYNVILKSDFEPQKIKRDLFKILVIGGSGGAKIFSEVLPKAFFNLKDDIKANIVITQQCRPELTKSTFEQYRSYNLNIIIDSFFHDMPQIIKESHLIIARAGSSSLFEFCAAKKPMILIPFAKSADNHQQKNANYLEKEGAAIVIKEENLKINEFSDLITRLIQDSTTLKKMSHNSSYITPKDSVSKIIKIMND